MASVLPALRDVRLDDKYELESGRVFLTGAQAFVRLLILQRQRDRLAGLTTGGFVSGYRGSPLGALDQSLWKAKQFLDRANVVFQPGLNEDLAATSIWGTQQLNLHAGARVDGVFAMWYGKGPGVDRCGDVFKHANMAGTSKHGGVLVLAGDDHAAKSSTIPHQSDHQFSAAMMPVLYPSSVQEILDLADILLEDAEDLVRKGYGWMLKAASEAHPQEVAVEPLELGRVQLLGLDRAGRRAQQRHGLAGHDGRRDHVGLVLAPQVLARQVDDGAHLREAGIVHQHVEVPGLPRHRVEHAADGLVVVDVELEAVDALGLERSQGIPPPGRGEDTVTAPPELARHGRPDAAGATGDEDGLGHFFSRICRGTGAWPRSRRRFSEIATAARRSHPCAGRDGRPTVTEACDARYTMRP